MNQTIKTGQGITIILIIAATVAFFTWHYQKNNQGEENIQVQTNIIKSNTTQSTRQKQSVTDETANWKIYENKMYKFSTQYPANYSYKEEQLEEGPGGVFYSIAFGKNPEDWENSITINVANIVADKLAAPNGMDPEFIKDITIGGMPGKNYDDESYVVSDGKYRFEIIDASEGSLKNELKCIVDAFKFIK